MSMQEKVSAPERTAIQPPTILQQISDTLRPRTEDGVASLYIAGIAKSFYDPEVILSPHQRMLDVEKLNILMGQLLGDLEVGVRCHHTHLQKISPATWEGNGIRFPSIEYGEEPLETQIIVTDFFSDLFFRQSEPKNLKVVRTSTTIWIYPSPQIAEFAMAVKKGQFYRLPKGFNHGEIAEKITSDQIRKLDEATLKPNDPTIDESLGR